MGNFENVIASRSWEETLDASVFKVSKVYFVQNFCLLTNLDNQLDYFGASQLISHM